VVQRVVVIKFCMNNCGNGFGSINVEVGTDTEKLAGFGQWQGLIGEDHAH